MKTALITGASSGIGVEFAKLLAQDKYNLILTARSENTLNTIADELTTQYKIDVVVIPHDLSLPGAGLELSEKITDKGIEVDVLINNAGFGDHGQFVESSMGKTIDMINLNVVNLTELSLIYGKKFADKKAGMLLNVASTAAFQPIPKMSVYAATKSYVLHFTEAMHFELKNSGVFVSALCPGATRTGFIQAANMENSTLFESNAMSAKTVAEKGYKGLKKNKAVIITGFKNAFLARFADATPFRKLKVWIASKMV
jgi:short-subunit dehydrogenase